MDYRIKTLVGDGTFSKGRGYFTIQPENPITIEDAVAHLNQNPNDTYLLSHLHRKMMKHSPDDLDRLMTDFAMPLILREGFILDAKRRGINEPISNNLISDHPLCFIRSQANSKVFGHDTELAAVFEQNREHLTPLSRMDKHLIQHLKQRYDHIIPDLQASPAKVFATGATQEDFNLRTSIRTSDPTSTLEQLENAIPPEIRSKLAKKEFSYADSVSLFIQWPLQAVVTRGGNYTLKGDMVSGGKGFDRTSALASGLCETIERISSVYGMFQEPELTKAKHSELNGMAIDPNSLSPKAHYNDFPIHWVLGTKQTVRGPKDGFLPVQFAYIFSNLDEPELCIDSSNGLASGNTPDEAEMVGIYEVLERYGDYSLLVDKERIKTLQAEEPSIARTINHYQMLGFPVQVIDMTTELGVPAYRAFIQSGNEIIGGGGSHLNGRIAIRRALGELNAKAYYLRDNLTHPETPVEHSGEIDFETIPNYSTGSVEGDLGILRKTLLINDYEPFTYQMRCEFPVVRVVIPGLEIPQRTNDKQIQRFMQAARGL